MKAHLAVVAALFSLSSCSGRDEPAAPVREDWVLKTHVEFLESDGKTSRPTPTESLRLWVPYVVGDLYGAPNAGELAPVTFNKDLSFVLDLNKSHENLAKALIPTEFTQKWMIIEPASARIARLSPFVLPTDGIEPVGVSEWLDADTGAKLMLVYLDRPSRIRGEVVYEGRNLSFDIEAKEAGYMWIEQPEHSGVFRKADWPGDVVLAVMPK